MNKIAASLLLICATLLTTACTNGSQIKDSSIIDLNSSSIINSEEDSTSRSMEGSEEKTNNINKSAKVVKLPIILMPKDAKEQKIIKYLEINEESPLKDKLELIVNAISKECFNGLPMRVKVLAGNIAQVELEEPENLDSSRVSWKDDYLNDQIKEYTLSVILKNLLQEEYKGDWIEKVQLYYEGESISLD
ncbi:MAG: hypothetical protein ACRC92_03275 [Peptostreptococcaceae bacterium]